ncbi:hypothetical protein F5B19DRAFT_494119 [Rostrohypoxylon terebratum]|nr:hypothetical protein F5B19DRAFT_494119 [Rostrohypoxylon terebratum]
MSLDSFHLFPRLPIELRRKIYLLATPSRIVRLRENHEGERRFRIRREFINYQKVTLHPSLSYFADEFQQILDDYVRVLPEFEWTVEFATADHPIVLDYYLRQSRFFSEAPIPVLLHTRVESREVLISAGYQLAFGSRDHDPWTWFHFENDILYLEQDYDFYSFSLPDIPDELGIFDFLQSSIIKLDLDSLKGVRKLALTNPYNDPRKNI